METTKAVDNIYLFRIKGTAGDAWKLAFQTEGSTEESREYSTDPTKDGNVKSAGAYEGSHSLTSFMAKDDQHVRDLQALVRKDNPGKLEVWELDRSDIDSATTIEGDYSVDVVTSVSKSSGAEGNVELSFETEVDGKVKAGTVDVTPELLTILQTLADEQTFEQPTTAV